MFEWFEQRWGRRQHLADADLVLYLDGELPAPKTGRVRRHLDGCWSCRAEKQRLEEAIRQYVVVRNAVLAAGDERPPGSAERFRRRLAAEDHAATGRRPRPLWRPAALLLAAAAVLLLGVAIARLATHSQVSADTALGRASAVVASRVSQLAAPVVVERLVVRRRGGTADRAEVRISFSGGVAAAEEPLWRETHALLSQYGLDEPWPLSPDAFRRWLTRVASDSGTRVVCREIEGGWEVRVTVPNAPVLAIREARLVLGTDWMPRRESFLVNTAAGACEYVLELMSFQVEARRKPAPAPAGSVTRPTPAAVVPPPAPRPAPGPTARDLDEAEIEVLYAVHRTGACLRYPLEIVRGGPGIEVRGSVRDGAQRAALQALLPLRPWLAVKLHTPEELLQSRKQAAPEDVQAPAGLVQSGTPLGEPFVLDHFRAGGAAAPVVASARFMTRAVQLSGEAAEHAWSLNRLTQTFPSGRTLEAGQSSRSLLAGMARDHAAAIRSRLSELRQQLAEVLPAGGAAAGDAPPGFESTVTTLLARVTEADRLVRRLFAGQPGEARDPTDTARKLMACFPEVEALTTAVFERADGEYRGR